MTLPRHHPPEELLLAHAAGVAPEAVSLLVATHLTLCPTCREQCDDLDAIGGVLLAGVEAHGKASEDDWTALASRSEASRRVAEPPVDGALSRPGVPLTLWPFLGGAPGWRRLLPGVRYARLSTSSSGRQARLLEIRRGFRVPLHTHRGTELTLVLKGGFGDAHGHYLRGDVAAYDESVQHEQRMDDAEDCVCLVVNDAPVRPLTWVGRLLNLRADL